MGAEGSMNYVLEKFRDTEREMRAEEWMNYVVEKLKEWLVLLENFDRSLIGKVDEVFPPETREEQLKRRLHVATPFIVAAVVLLMCHQCCRGRGGGRAVKMMKAPGRPLRMRRPDFEEIPRLYFRGLRGKR